MAQSVLWQPVEINVMVAKSGKMIFMMGYGYGLVFLIYFIIRRFGARAIINFALRTESTVIRLNTLAENYLFAAFKMAASKPSVVCSFASSVGWSPKVVIALVVSGPMEAIFSCGNCFSIFGRSKRA